MRRTVISPQKNLPMQQNQQQTTNAINEKSKHSDGRRNVVVAALSDRPSHPYSSISLSPRGRYAILAGKGTIQLVSIGPEGLKTIRTLKIDHHFFSTSAAASSSPGATGGVSDVRDAFRLAAETRASAVTAGVANMNLNQQYGNVVVTKVSWSNNFYLSTFRKNRPKMSSQRGLNGTNSDNNDNELDLSTRSTSSMAEAYEVSSRHRRKSNRFQNNPDEEDGDNLLAEETMKEDDSLVAAAGSNGVVLVWSAKKLLFSDSGMLPPSKTKGGFITSKTSSAAFLAQKQRTQQPEGILDQHTRAVNCMVWHPTKSGLLLTASQDGKIKLWERKLLTRPEPKEEMGDKRTQDQQRSWLSMVGVGGGPRDGGRGSLAMGDEDGDSRNFSWGCRATYSLGEQDAAREISWNKLHPDLFGAVTANGNLVVYNMHVSVKALVKIAAHTGDAASLDWHPRWPFVVATGGSSDRFVKIWDLESSLASVVNTSNQNKSNIQRREISVSRKDVQQQNQQENSNTMGTTKSETSTFSASSNESLPSSISSIGPSIREAIIRSTTNTGYTIGSGRREKSTASSFSKHVLSISASVTQVRWRPPSNDFVPSSPTTLSNENRSDTSKEEVLMDRHDTMLAVVAARQTSAGGSGTLSLWSFHRPFMSLSIVEGHQEGAISDFVWIQTPQVVSKPIYGSFDNQYTNEPLNISYIWQNVLSVGRDGRCIMQSFARGERRIRSVPSSCFAMANLSPFQRGYGSLQFFSVYQDVPNRPEDDFMLTGLRQDEHTANAPGIFFEEDLRKLESSKEGKKKQDFAKRFPENVPKLHFSVLDQGILDSNGLPIVGDEDALCIAPEVLHMSRFARLYKLYPDKECSTRAELCLYNSKVAEALNCGPLARMWKTVSSLLYSSGLEELTEIDPSKPTNAFQFVVFRTVKSLLLERAEAGDVQTNVALCEVLQVVDSSGEETRIPGLSVKLVREWYLYYIDLLHQMCLFSAAAFLIKNCNDPAIGALSQQSTTIHESCPRCGKPIEPSADTNASSGSARQVCKSCRRRVAVCFICHEPVTGMFVWCPGCGHGGHLEHALQWFGGLKGKEVRSVCPTGCGHKCNLVQMSTSFPRTISMAAALSDKPSSIDSLVAMKGHQPRCIPATNPT